MYKYICLCLAIERPKSTMTSKSSTQASVKGNTEDDDSADPDDEDGKVAYSEYLIMYL